LYVHCYRMLGSPQDAEDALQEALLRAWRGLPRFGQRSSLRTWLYAIATNASLRALERGRPRVLPVDLGPAADPHADPDAPLTEAVWVEPLPDSALPSPEPAPEARYEQRESVELAFIAALQHLAPNQRAVLILREVLGFSAKETAQILKTTAASVNSALQRARAAVEERVPARTQQATLRSLGDDEVRELVARYVDAWERCDVDAFAAMLADDATFAMPPMATWYRTRRGIAIWARQSPLSGDWRWRAVATRANGQPALAFYAWDEDERAYLRFALNVLTFRDSEIANVTAFIARTIESSDPEAFERHPEQPPDPRQIAVTFERFGLPERLV
ncbi:MAG TPA: RNA polymerase subunit sigma-70, partial [Solirubrobacteraceae bacterium]